MKIPCKEIRLKLEEILREEVAKMHEQGNPPKLLDILVGNAPEQVSYVAIKGRVAEKLGIGFKLQHFTDIPTSDEFIQYLQADANNKEITGVIIQLPLPKDYDIEKIYQTIPLAKEIEGHKEGSTFEFPLSLAVLNGIKYVFNNERIDNDIMVNLPEDVPYFQRVLKGKKIVIVGRGPTGGGPIGKAFKDMAIPFETIHSKTENAAALYKEADIIVTAVGKKVVTADMIKPGVILLNVGLREEDGKLKGDYDEEEIDAVAGYYTPTPGGLGPIDVQYLYKNLLDATKKTFDQ